mgnify:FL=1
MADMNDKERLAREEERAAKRRARLEKHAVPCPHCGKSVLDHMTRCPYCGGTLVPAGYVPMDEEKKQKIKKICYAVGTVVAVVIIVLIIIFR